MVQLASFPTNQISTITPVPADAKTVQSTIDRSILPHKINSITKQALNVVHVRIDVSLDAGKTWSPDPDGRSVWPWGAFPYTFTASGESLTDELTAKPVMLSGIVDIPLPPGSTHIRETVTPL